MSSPFDNRPLKPVSVDSSPEELTGARLSLDAGMLDRYLLGALRPDEELSARAFFSHRLIARVPAWLREWAERDANAEAPNPSQNIRKFWEQIREHDASARQFDRDDLSKAGRNFEKPSLARPHVQAVGRKTLRNARSTDRRSILRHGLWLGALSIVIFVMMSLTKRDSHRNTNASHLYTTRVDQQALVNLDDGTRITLAPQTTLRILQFSANARTVILENGEAYFEIAHTTGIPFLVRSGTATVRALGTAFLVRHEPSNRHVRVVVLDGKIRVTPSGHDNASVTLVARQIGDVTDSVVQASTADDVTPGTEWGPGKVLFRDTPVSAVLKVIAEWYGYQFRYADTTLGVQSVSITVSTRSSAEALAELERVLAVDITVAGDTVTLVPQSPRPSRRAPRLRTYDAWSSTREVGR